MTRALLVGCASALVLVTVGGEVRANLGDPCPLAQVGSPCAGAGTCVKFTCDFQSSQGAHRTEALGFCDGTPNLCPPGSAYMGACGTAGKCWAGQTSFGGSDPDGGTMSCTAGIYTCIEPPPGAPPVIVDASTGFAADAGFSFLASDGSVGKGQAPHEMSGDAGAARSGGNTAQPSLGNSSGGCSISSARTPTSPPALALAPLVFGIVLRLGNLRRPRRRRFR